MAERTPKRLASYEAAQTTETLAPPSDNDRLAAQLRIIPLFDGSIESVHIDMDDFAYGHLATILFLFPGQAGVERTRVEAAKRRLNVQLFVADMLDLTEIPDRDFDAVMCMDNALPHLESDEQLFQAATQIRRKLRGGAIFLGSIRDYDSLVQERPVVQRPAFFSDQEGRRIVHQVWDWSDERRYAFHLYITREVQGGWETQHYVSNYRAVLREEFSRILQEAGFVDCRWILTAESGFYQPIVLAKADSTP
jgi:glycine/sarcosine N-methyltransferase